MALARNNFRFQWVIDQFVVVDIIGNIANLGTSEFVYASPLLIIVEKTSGAPTSRESLKWV